MAASAIARAESCSVDEAIARLRDARPPSRRAVLRGAAVLGAGGLLPMAGCRRRGFAQNPGGARVVVVGGGLAGLSCLHTLAKKGIYAELYEAQDTVGGRVLTARGLFQGGAGLHTELGGQFIDSWHEATLALAEDLDLTLIDRETDLPLERTFFINGARYTETELAERLLPIAEAVDACYEVIQDDGETISYEVEAGASGYDNQSLAEFLSACDGDDVINRLIEAAYLSEYGLDLAEQSALNLILMLGTDPGALDLYGGSDERYMISGGNDLLATGLADRYGDRVHLGASLEAVIEGDDQTTLVFEDGTEVEADVVVLTLPFTVLRRLDLQVAMSDVKRRCINELGYGMNAKVLLPFSRRFWRDQGESGEVYTSLDIQSTWDSTQLQDGTLGVLTVHLGGARGVSVGNGTVEEQAALCLADLELVYPGCGDLAGADPRRQHWPSVPTALGSYACYKVGQYTSIGGAEGEPVGNIFFAGEHCSYDSQGYLNGAIETGQQAARDVASLLNGSRVRVVPRATRRLPRVGLTRPTW